MLKKEDKIKALLKSKGLTQQDLASKLGISRNYLLTILKDADINNIYLAKVPGVLGIEENEWKEIVGLEEGEVKKIDLIIKYENLKKDYEALDIKYKGLEESYKRALADLDYFKGLVNTLSGNRSENQVKGKSKTG